jgi:hypothetical protein
MKYILYSCLLAKVKRLSFIFSPNMGISTPLEQHYKLSKVGQNSLPEHKFLRDLKDNYNTLPMIFLTNLYDCDILAHLTMHQLAGHQQHSLKQHNLTYLPVPPGPEKKTFCT